MEWIGNFCSFLSSPLHLVVVRPLFVLLMTITDKFFYLNSCNWLYYSNYCNFTWYLLFLVVHFWAPTFKWGISIANIADFAKPPEKLSYPQQIGIWHFFFLIKLTHTWQHPRCLALHILYAYIYTPFFYAHYIHDLYW